MQITLIKLRVYIIYTQYRFQFNPRVEKLRIKRLHKARLHRGLGNFPFYRSILTLHANVVPEG